MSDIAQRLQTDLAGRFRIERELGRGGMAIVFLAEDLRHRRPVAIKVLTPELSAAIGAERFLREIETAARLTHPHILALHESGVAAGLPYYVMPFAEGESLRRRIDRERQLPVADAVRFAREIAGALEAAHRGGVIHRDVKPENVLLAGDHAMVADFGIARAIASSGGERLTETGVTLGTPAYMSPEQLSASRDVDGRADVYSLGCVLYEMLAGVPPFVGATAASLAHQHLNVAPRPVTDLRPAVPAPVTAAIQRALAKSPADRFARAADFAAALDAAEPATAAVAPGTAAGVTAATAAIGAASPPEPPSRRRLAVLPFVNLSGEGPFAYFAGGLHDELLTQLSKVSALRVISRTSTLGYAGSGKPLRLIAEELGVRAIVEGSVQVVGDRLRVNVQLIDAATDEHLWAERYDRVLDDAFAIQSEVAQRVVAAVGGALTAGERGRIAAAPTHSAEAYRAYLQARELFTRPNPERSGWDVARQHLDQALALDPGFALARAARSMAHGYLHWFRLDPSPQHAALQREDAERALRDAPDLPQSHLAMGLVHYYGRRDFGAALVELEQALSGMPSDAELWGLIGAVRRRLGQWSEAFVAFEKAAQLDPRFAPTWWDYFGISHHLLRHYPQAIEAYERAARLSPDHAFIQASIGMARLAWLGELDTLQAVCDRLAHHPDAGVRLEARAPAMHLLLWRRNGEGLVALASEDPAGVASGPQGFQPNALFAGWGHQLRGDDRAAGEAFENARVVCDAMLRRLPDDWRVRASHGLALAGLGRTDEARREAAWLAADVVYRSDAFFGTLAAWNRALILAGIGDVEDALDEVDALLARPSYVSPHTIRVEPRLDALREHRRFARMIAAAPQPAA